MTVVHGNAPWQTCRRHAAYLASHVYKRPPPEGGYSTKYPERIAEVEAYWEDWHVFDNHAESGMVARLYKLKSFDPDSSDPSLCPPCLAFRGTDFHDMRGMAIAASIRWRIFEIFGWTHDFTFVADSTMPKKMRAPGRRQAARGAEPIEVPYTRDELIALDFRPFPIFHEEGETDFETAADGSTWTIGFRVMLDLLAKEDGDWIANIIQGLGHPTKQYQEAEDAGREVASVKILELDVKRLEITGHSLGGSLAAAVTCILDSEYPDISFHGMTFNAAGVHENTVKPASLGDGDIHDFTVAHEILTTLHTYTNQLPIVGSIFTLAERTINQMGLPPAIGQVITQRGKFPPGTDEAGSNLPVLFPIEDQTADPGYTEEFPLLLEIDGMLASSPNIGQFGSRFLEWLNERYRAEAIQNNRDSEEGYWFPDRIDRTYTEIGNLFTAELEPEIDVLLHIVGKSVEFHGMDYVIAAYDAKYGAPT